MKKCISLGIAFLVTTNTSFAAMGSFSKDGSHAYVIAYTRMCDTTKFLDLDLTNKTCKPIDLHLPAKSGFILGVTLSNTQSLLCATTHAIWSYDPATTETKKICDAPVGMTLLDVAYDPVTEQLLITANLKADGWAEEGSSIFCLQKNGKRLTKVRSRYGTNIGHPVFAADGTLFFEDLGDLWMGFIRNGNDDINDPALELDAYRCAPLAFRIEQNTSPSSTGLRDLAVTQHCIYADFARIEGSGWGSVIRFQRPSPLPSDKSEKSLPDVGDINAKALQSVFGSVEELEDVPCKFIFASRDGSQVLFSNLNPGWGGTAPYLDLVENDGKPSQIEIKGLSEFFK